MPAADADSPAFAPTQPVPRLRLFLFGSFRLERDDEPIHLPTRKAESLLAFLALHPQAHAREKLAALFWGDSPDDLARRSLRTALASLRKELGDDLITADREVVQFNSADHVWVDALEFQRRAAQFVADDLSDSTAITFDLYRGDLLADFYDDWILAERERLRALYLDALLRMTQRLREQSEYARAIDTACKALSVDPANEPAHQHLMSCRWSLGDRSAALQQFDECRRALYEELGVEPSTDTVALYERIKRSSVITSPATARTNLPIPLTGFVGREREMEAVKQLLGTTRLLTLTGVGGCGKTRLAIQVTRDLLDQFADGVWWVELASAREGERVLQGVVQALGLVEGQHKSPLEAVLNHLRSKHALLVLDNCEHLINACAELTETILTRCSNVRIVTTSREALSISGEVAWLVPSLRVPAKDDVGVAAPSVHSESMRLFVERARTIRHNFGLTAANASAVANICRRLDGIPLAIELAAARLRALTIEQIDARLDDRFGLLTMGSRTSLPRQQTLRATIDWSYALLSSAEQALLRRLSVFSGGWTLEAAEVVCMGDEVEAAQVLDLLTYLAEKSLVVSRSHEGEIRFDMLETVREYAREKLSEAGEFQMTSDRQLRFFSELAQVDGKRLRGSGQLDACRQLEREYDNLRAAFVWGLQPDKNHLRFLDALRLVTSLWHLWNMRGEFVEGHGWLQGAINRIGTLIVALNTADTNVHTGILTDLRSLKALALFGEGVLTWFSSSKTGGLAQFEESAALAQQVGDTSTFTYAQTWIAYQRWDSNGDLPAALATWDECEAYFHHAKDDWGVAWVLAFKGFVYRLTGDYANSRLNYQGSADIGYRLGDRWTWSIGVGSLGLITAAEGDYSAARAKFQLLLTLARELGFKWYVTFSLLPLGHIACIERDFEQATARFKEGLGLSLQTGMIQSLAQFLKGLARVSMATGNPQRAVRLFCVSSGTEEELQLKDAQDEHVLLDKLRSEMGDAAFQAAWAEGQAITLEQAVEEATRV